MRILLSHTTCVVLWLMVIGATVRAHVNYTGYQVVSIDLKQPEEKATLLTVLDAFNKDIGSSNEDVVDVWRAEGDVMDVMLHSRHTSRFLRQLSRRSLPSRVKIEDVDSLMANERERRSVEDSFSLNKYNSYDEITSYLSDLADFCSREFSSTFSSKFSCGVESVGGSWEGRKLKVVRVGRRVKDGDGDGRGGGDRPVVIVDAGTHAREWIAVATALRLVDRLVRGASNGGVRAMLRAADWYIQPLVNPDGYQYTRDRDRMWRKTRSIHPELQTGSRSCVGVDSNRNWDYQWGGPGSSSNCNSEDYHGPRPFSEPETRAWARYISNIRGKKVAYITLHSYGQYLIYPWGYKKVASDDVSDHSSLLKAMSRRMERIDGARYKVVLGSKTLGATSGVSDDWTYANQSVKYSHTIELRDEGKYGFLLPQSKIGVTSDELFVGLKQMVKTLKSRGEL